MSRAARLSVIGIAALTAGLLVGGPTIAWAEPDLEGPPPGDPLDPFTSLVVTDILDGSETEGTRIPVVEPPGAYPTEAAADEAHYAALIEVQDTVDPSLQALTYCIDLLTSTNTGVGYQPGDWSGANVPNLPYISHILQNYYPTVAADDPANPLVGLTVAQQVAAVQTAIWYFSDGYVLATDFDATVREATASVVAAALADPDDDPVAPPSLSVTPSTAQLPDDGTLAGPFTVTAENVTGEIVVEDIEGVLAFLDAAGEDPVAEGDVVPQGAQLWLAADGPGPDRWIQLATFTEVTSGLVFVFDPESDPERTTAQKLILASSGEVAARAGVNVTEVYAAGSLILRKTIAGAAAGQQGAITIDVTCVPAPAPGVVTSVTFPAGTTAGSHVVEFTGLPIGAECTVTESVNGADQDAILQSATITPGTVVIAAAPQTVQVTNTYTRPLAATGVDATGWLAGGAAVLLLGGLLLGAARARRS